MRTHPPDGMAQVVMTDRELHEYEQWLMATRGAPLFRIPISEEDDLPTYGIGVSDRTGQGHETAAAAQKRIEDRDAV